MNFKLKTLIAAAVMLAGSAFAGVVSAAVPNLTVSYTGSAVSNGLNQVIVTVNDANPYSQVSLYYSQSSSYYNIVTTLGQTDVSGYLSAVTSIPTNGSTSPILYYAVVGGIQSNTVSLAAPNSGSGCYYVSGIYTCGSGSLSLSQTSVTMTIGQNLSLNIYTGSTPGAVYGNDAYFIASNSSSSVVTAGVSGSVLNLLAIGSGTSTVQVCPSGASNGSSACANVYVTVNFNGLSNNGNITLSQSSLTLNIGQSSSVQIYSNGSSYNGYGNTFTVNNNSNSSVVSASISGSTLTVYGSGVGNATLSVCSQNGYASASPCASLYVTVNGNGNGTGSCYYVNGVYTCQGTSNCYNNGYSTNCTGQNSLTFSVQNPTLNVGQSAAVVIYGNGVYNSYNYNNYQSYQVSGNSNASVVSASTSGNSLNLVGMSNGSSVISVCSLYGSVVGTSGTSCGTVYVTVGNSNIGTGTCYYIGNVYTCPGQVLGASTYPSGTLIQQGSTIYMVYRNTLTAFGNYGAFVGLGFRTSNVVNVGYTNIPISGYVISTQFAPHPWGTWIKSGQAIYFVSEYGLIPVPDYNTFLNNGGSSANVVTANAYDFQLPLQSPMVSQDSRLR